MGEGTRLYDLWDGKSIIGQIALVGNVLSSTEIIIPMLSALKMPYGKEKMHTIKLPVIPIKISETYNEVTFRLVLDVRRKSKRQIKQLLEHNTACF